LHGARHEPVSEARKEPQEPEEKTERPPIGPARKSPVFIVQGKGAECGQLLTDRFAEREGWALVRFEAGIEEVSLDELKIVRIE
jgi:hypothetical protein